MGAILETTEREPEPTTPEPEAAHHDFATDTPGDIGSDIAGDDDAFTEALREFDENQPEEAPEAPETAEREIEPPAPPAQLQYISELAEAERGLYEFASELRQNQDRYDTYKFVNELRETVSDLDMPDEMMVAWLYGQYHQNPRVAEAFDGRFENPGKWNYQKTRLAHSLSKATARRYDPVASEAREAVALAVRGANAEQPAPSFPDVSRLSDAELTQLTRSMGFDWTK